MQEVLKTLEELDPQIEAIGYLVADESLAYFRKALERAKRATGLVCELEVQGYKTDPNNPEKVRYTVFIFNHARTKVLLVGCTFPHIEVYENSAQWHRTAHLNPEIVYHSGVKVEELFKKSAQDIEI